MTIVVTSAGMSHIGRRVRPDIRHRHLAPADIAVKTVVVDVAEQQLFAGAFPFQLIAFV